MMPEDATPEEMMPEEMMAGGRGLVPTVLGPIERYEQSVVKRISDFQDPRQEWRRIFSEVLGTFFLVLVAAGGGLVGPAVPDTHNRTAGGNPPALVGMGILLFLGQGGGGAPNPPGGGAFLFVGPLPW